MRFTSAYLKSPPKVPFGHKVRRLAVVVCLLAAACSTSSRGTATGGAGGGAGEGDAGYASDASHRSDTPASDTSASLGIQATRSFTQQSLSSAEQVDVPFTFSPSRTAPRLQASGCDDLALDGATAYPAVIELLNVGTSPLDVTLFSVFSHIEALVVYSARPETSADLLHSCVAVAASEGVSRYGFSQSSPSTFRIAPASALYVYAQRSEDMVGAEQSASVSVIPAK